VAPSSAALKADRRRIVVLELPNGGQVPDELAAGCPVQGMPLATPLDFLAVSTDLRPQSPVQRQARLQELCWGVLAARLFCCSTFRDGLALLRVVEQRGLGKVVGKSHDAPLGQGGRRD